MKTYQDPSVVNAKPANPTSKDLLTRPEDGVQMNTHYNKHLSNFFCNQMELDTKRFQIQTALTSCQKVQQARCDRAPGSMEDGVSGTRRLLDVQNPQQLETLEGQTEQRGRTRPLNVVDIT